jgi:iron complex transport system substrate-binding protein
MHITRTAYRRARRTSLATALVATTALTALALAGCGTTEAPADAAGSPSASSTAATGPVTVTGADGTVHLDAPATRVVSLEWGLTENLLALGVKPVGEADVKGYNTWDHSAALPASTPDVGTRGEPSLDAIVALHPDLVVATTDLPSNVIAKIAEKYPVLTLKGSEASDPVAYMRKTVTTLADATGTEMQGAALLKDFDAKVASGKAALAKAGEKGAPFTMSDGWIDSGNVSIRMYTPGSFLGAVAAELGMKNQWTSGGDKVYGLATTDVEGLTKVTNPKTHFLYAANSADGGDPFTKGLSGNAIWKKLPFVAAGNVHRIPDGIWMFGGPLSAEAYIDAVVNALT